MAVIINQFVKVRASNRNKTYYANLGYTPNEKQEFKIHLKDLPLSSPSEVKIVCDYCNKCSSKPYKNISSQKNHFCSRECANNFLIGKPSWNARLIHIKCSECSKDIIRSEWETKQHKNLFCSRSCADNFMRRNRKGKLKVKRYELKCSFCNATIERTENELKRAKNHFCSQKCLSEFSKGKPKNTKEKIKKLCHNCNKPIYMTPYRALQSKRTFCSRNCRSSWMRESDEYRKIVFKGKSVELTCSNESCNKTFTRKFSELKEKNFCSMECAKSLKKLSFIRNNPNPKKEKISVSCYTCGAGKKVHESVFKKNKHFFCSYDCYHQKRLEITEKKVTLTSIHKKINRLLNECEIEHINEKNIGYFSLDIYLPEHKLAIEVMGDYWHGHPQRYNFNSLNNIQKKNIKRDYRKNRYITKNGIVILYLWENDINQDFELCKQLILKFISKRDGLQNFHSFNWALDSNSKIVLRTELFCPFFDYFQGDEQK
ncbi:MULTISPECIES: PDDEXK family nuclease [Bacillus]|uniref:TRASH domain-containing protein n=1 Tax=Bacillus sonorensis TaxID=119858 RepID=A0ABN5AM49_9BACI|nr:MULTISPECIES: hypothetical protein [Bacillus]ASB89405.1 hypothetical protein S101395_02898 [Bacillus sonorensis]MEC0338283.1 hypothetical protein [Bacillus sonorensis]MEC0425140.1 hypothetical protein [Bacillus sonorensis]MEC0460694.1 hypothetical protein [Bacillus sonorensis]MEC0526349.1 hypothetical protein [Bacillus sonorensis]